ncbi:hypothetical protein [Mycobacterium talmoniae]|uniref:Uncharacterized protein n=1 Tax=Mycobacterium talmoniae TaxID=1858794 RepID=A0A1S1NJQ0_9MYCO|nr:hypothetical protein [Mycobacterium talmoniae]OHV04303.1 hypothetical protein BKN37_10670 [Mycobacterium talmoniae]
MGGPYPGAPYPPPGYPGAAPSGGTAIAAAVLSFLGAVASGVGVIGTAIALSAPWAKYASTGYFAFSALVSLALAAALTTGGILLLRRRLVGRTVIAGACAAAMLIALIGFAYGQHMLHNISSEYGMPVNSAAGLGYGMGGLLFNLVMPAITMALALVPSTRLWCLASPARTGAPAPGPW